jgi:hypothetical protein
VYTVHCTGTKEEKGGRLNRATSIISTRAHSKPQKFLSVFPQFKKKRNSAQQYRYRYGKELNVFAPRKHIFIAAVGREIFDDLYFFSVIVRLKRHKQKRQMWWITQRPKKSRFLK